MSIKEQDTDSFLLNCPSCSKRSLGRDIVDFTMMFRLSFGVPVWDTLYYQCQACGYAFIEENEHLHKKLKLGSDLRLIATREETPQRVSAEGWYNLFSRMRSLLTKQQVYIEAFDYMLGNRNLPSKDYLMLQNLKSQMQEKGSAFFKSKGMWSCRMTAPDVVQVNSELVDWRERELGITARPGVAPSGWVDADGRPVNLTATETQAMFYRGLLDQNPNASMGDIVRSAQEILRQRAPQPYSVGHQIGQSVAGGYIDEVERHPTIPGLSADGTRLLVPPGVPDDIAGRGVNARGNPVTLELRNPRLHTQAYTNLCSEILNPNSYLHD